MVWRLGTRNLAHIRALAWAHGKKRRRQKLLVQRNGKLYCKTQGRFHDSISSTASTRAESPISDCGTSDASISSISTNEASTMNPAPRTNNDLPRTNSATAPFSAATSQIMPVIAPSNDIGTSSIYGRVMHMRRCAKLDRLRHILGTPPVDPVDEQAGVEDEYSDESADETEVEPVGVAAKEPVTDRHVQWGIERGNQSRLLVRLKRYKYGSLIDGDGATPPPASHEVVGILRNADMPRKVPSFGMVQRRCGLEYDFPMRKRARLIV